MDAREFRNFIRDLRYDGVPEQEAIDYTCDMINRSVSPNHEFSKELKITFKEN